MDTIASILPQIASANGATGTAASEASESGLFASLLAVQTTPVAPVPAVNARPPGETGFIPPSSTPETGPALAVMTNASTTLSAATSSTTGHPADTAIVTAQFPTSNDGIVTAKAVADPAGSPVPANTGGATEPVLVTQSAGPSPATMIAGSSQPAVENPLMDAAASMDKSAPGIDAKTTTQPAATLSPATLTGTSDLAAPATVTTPQSAPTTSPNPAAIADIATQAGQTAVQSALPATAPAGVQARRDAVSGDRTPGALALSGSKTVSASPATGTNSIPSELKLTSSPPPPTATSPQIQAPQGDVQPEAARPGAAGDKPAPPPVSDLTSSETDAEGDRIDLSTLRAADASRTAERPGTAAGSARFTPATAGSLAAQIAARFQNGDRKFAIRMDPPELGKIEVKLHVGNDNRVHALLSAERPETLNDMRQYARELERALEEAGLQLEHDGLSFELSQDGEQADDNPPGAGGFSNLEFAEDLSGPVVAAMAPPELYGFRLTAPPGVNVRL